MRDTVVVGDVHGCGEELSRLFRRLRRWAPDCDIVLVGDLLTKGPRPDLVIDAIHAERDAGRKVRLVCGNHEPRALAALRRAGSDGRTHRLPPRLAAMVECLAEADMIDDAIALLREAMEHTRISGGRPRWHAIHAGVDPKRGVQGTSAHLMMTIKAADGETDWWWAYDGRDGLLIVGHKPLSRPLVLRRPDGRAVVAAIDTGCVYGGFLTAYRVGTDRLLMVRSRQRRQYTFRRRSSRRPADTAWRVERGDRGRTLVH